MNKNSLILKPIFIVSLLTLILNDFWLKNVFSNELTGKLSDFAGLVVLPVFISFLFPKTKKWICFLTATLFIIWKTPLVTPFINFFNSISIFSIDRTIDYTDYLALMILPIAHIIINEEKLKIEQANFFFNFLKIGISLVSFFAICATSVIRPYEMPKGTIFIGEKYTIKKSKFETIEAIKSLGYNVDTVKPNIDSTNLYRQRFRKITYYQTDNIIIYNEFSKPIDTILNVKYSINVLDEKKSQIEIINVTLSKDGNIQSWQTLKYLKKQYKKIIENKIVKNVK